MKKILLIISISLTLFSSSSLAQFGSGPFGDIAGSGSGDGAPTNATYITQTSNSTLTNEQAISSLSTGIMRVATSTGSITSLTDSAGIASNISDETGTAGGVVFSASPTITGTLTADNITVGNGENITLDDQVVDWKDIGPLPYLTFRRATANEETRFGIIPNGTVSASDNALLSGIKIFGTDFQADQTNYFDFGIYTTPNDLRFNSKKGGSASQRPFVWSFQDTSKVMQLDDTGDLTVQSVRDYDGPGTNWSITAAGVITGTSVVASGVFRLPNSNSLPGTCTVGDVYMDADATSGQRIYACESTNTWALQGDGGGGGSGDVTDVWGCSTGDCNQITIGENEFLNGGAVDGATDPYIKLPNGTSCSTVVVDGAICWDTDNDQLFVGNGASATQIGSGAGGGSTTIPLPIYSAKISGTFVTATISGLDVSSQGASIDAGDGNWRVLFDATTDESAVFTSILPSNYSSAPVCKIAYSMNSGTANEAEWECAVMCVTPGDAADIGTASFAAGATAVETVPGTAGHTDTLVSITPTDDSCAAGDIIYVYISTDSDDATNDDATGDRELVGAYLSFTGL